MASMSHPSSSSIIDCQLREFKWGVKSHVNFENSYLEAFSWTGAAGSRKPWCRVRRSLKFGVRRVRS
ncbi:hypothetical protein CY34DRAFT_802284 [Suillus luteus UH-Slu-Lm8-n1]|uniref:Uncharacterized protein n=1 Tax=Suillus luteus UH-Slu-Lm8-n1 TaxID=930992 RepID=A0A0D0A429_9AGAM|nr:hypothetical protein CY34DRAFT_802284 [Suillus luteus UH-Slu-Lm8-n1]